ncbi:MAG: BamA/TamA family outer membrane protein [Candidatus Aegiribacteria sp.]|nr:BamA/TamA family outer membrane protein [Candidatus Aegiribacteria sp.]
MKKALILFLPVLFTICFATSYGRNKVQVGEHEWWEIQGRHFTIYFPQGGEIPAETLLVHTERELIKLSEEFNYMPEEPIPIVLYISPGHFRQTDINPYEIPQAVGGFTEFYKGRVVIPFTGYWSEFRHVIAHELNHAFIFDMLYKRSLLNIITGGTPLWMMEGLAEYTSLGWDAASEAEFRDMVISYQIVSIDELSRRNDYLVYREGQAIYHFMNERYGEEKYREFVQRINIRGRGNFDSNVESNGSSNGQRRSGDIFDAVFDMSSAQFSEKFLEWARETYWSELACCESPSDIANAIYSDDERIMQINSIVSTDGRFIAGVEYHHAHLAVTVRSAVTGEVEERPFVSGGISDVSVSPMYRICSFSPTADSIVVAAQYVSGDQLIICSDGKKDNLPFELDLIRDPAWSSCGRYIGFAGMDSGQLNIYVWDILEQELSQINDDISGERDLSWIDDRILCAAESVSGETRIIEYTLEGESVTVLADSSEIRYPISVPDGILFMSNMSGFPDLYLLQDGSDEIVRLTALYRTIDSPSWAASSDILTFVSRDWNGSGVFLAYDIIDRRVIACEHGAFHGTTAGTEDRLIPEYYPIADSTEASEQRGRRESRSPTASSELIPEAAPSDDISVQRSEDEFLCGISPYTPRLTIDYVSAMAAYDSYLGISGYTTFILSDMLAHHQIVLNTNLNGGSLSDVDVAVFYGYLPHRTDLVFGLMRQSYRYLFKFSDGHYEEVRDVDITGFGMARYPISPSLRISGLLEYRHLSRTGTWNSTADIDEDILSLQAGVVFDNALWGSVGPRVGSRLSIVGEYAPSISGSASYSTVMFDFRNYLWVSQRVTFATRLAGGTSWGPDAQNFFLGGAIPHRLLWGKVETIDELLGFYTNYGDILRGYDYASIQGRGYGIFSAELRVPFVNTLALDAPLPLTFRNGRGVLFFDLGCAFDDLSSFHGASTAGGYHLDDLKMSLGIGYRINLGYFLLKHDIAWRTDLRGISRKPEQNITIGAEF